MNDYYIYGYFRLDTDSYFYIGKGRNKRCLNISNRTEEFNDIVNNVPYKIEILCDNLSEDDAYYFEELIIKDLVFNKGYSISIYGWDKKLFHLVNRSWGGRTNYGYHHTEESKEKLSKAHTGKHLSEETKRKLSEINTGEKHPQYGTKHSEETRKRISESLTGKKFSEDRKRRLSEAHKGIPNLTNRKKVKCIELNKVFNSISEAREFLGYKKLKISEACRGIRNSAGKLEDGTKLHWEFVEETYTCND